MSNNYSKWAPPGTKRRRKGWRKRRRERRARLAQEAAERLAASAPTASPDKRSAPTPARAARSTPAPGHEADEGATASSTRPVPEKLWKNPLLVTGALTVLVIVAITALWGFAYGRPAVRSRGYTGTATNTGVLSEAWASGVDTAWVIPNEKRKGAKAAKQNLLVQGTTLYVASVEEKSGSLTLTAYDIASSSPRQLWVSDATDVHMTRGYFHAEIIPYGTKLLVGNAIVDGRTGEQTQAPWEDDTAMAAVDDIVVTCGRAATCSGWTQDSGAWTRVWTTQTGSTIGQINTWHLHGSRVVGTGAQASFISLGSIKSAPSLINIRTGKYTRIGEDPGSLRSGPVYYRASDGIAVVDTNSEVTLLDPSGAVIERFTGRDADAVATDDGPPPTLEELRAFLRDGRASWTSGTAGFDASTCEDIVFFPSADLPPKTLPRINTVQTNAFVCSFQPSSMRASANGAAMVLELKEWQEHTVYVLDLEGSRVLTPPALRDATNLTWAFDDLLIVVTWEGVVAFTPRSS